eukprot:scaffold115663_cov17-Tisochrysis_lutea.AAC.1
MLRKTGIIAGFAAKEDNRPQEKDVFFSNILCGPDQHLGGERSKQKRIPHKSAPSKFRNRSHT